MAARLSVGRAGPAVCQLAISEVRLSKSRHPYLTRGIVHTSTGAFAVIRGIVDAPDAVGEELGWLRIDEEHSSSVRVADSADGLQKIAARTAVYG